MKSLRAIFGILSIAVFAVGCDASKYPIDATPQIKTDSRMIGKWKAIEKDGSKETYSISTKDEFNYKISFKWKGSKKTEVCTAFLSEVDKYSFMNVFYKDNEDTVGGYFFFRILDIKPEKMTLLATGDSLLKKLNSPTEVRNYFLKNKNNPKFYGDTVHFRKIK
jgi:hypothetical protein